ncbi:MAG: phosphoadenosine phosphosulfate reductase family protein, partial [Flavobacteriaceae bacterium]
MSFTQEQIDSLNHQFRGIPPEEIISWSIENASTPVVTTNFRPYEVVILSAVAAVRPDLPVIWCDTGYNTPHTYRHAEELIEKLGLNIKLFVP